MYFIQMLNKRQKAMITQRQRHYSMTKQKRQKQYFIEMLGNDYANAKTLFNDKAIRQKQMQNEILH